MAEPRRVLYLAENAISAIQGGGIVVYAVLKGLPPDRLLGFFDYRNITPAPEYADRFVYLGPWRTPPALAAINRLSGNRTATSLRCLFAEHYLERDFAFITQEIARRGFVPDVVYYSGLSYRYMRLAVMAAEHYNLPMVLLHMDDWMEVEREGAGRWGDLCHRRTVEQMRRAAARSLASTTNSPRLAARVTKMTGYRHVPANNCCADLMACATAPERTAPNRIPVITYAGAMNRHLQGETLKVLASAVTELNAEGTRVHLHIYTPWEFAPEANAIAVPHAVFYKGQVGREQLADVYRRADFLVTTVTYRDPHISLFRHSLSTKLSEYLCAGKPVISMGHYDWHLHEYVQEQGCGFSILMDGNFSRAAIKKQLQRILATPKDELLRIGTHNRGLWARAHDVTVMAADTRRALRIDAADRRHRSARPATTSTGRSLRGVIDLGGARTGWVPSAKANAIARRLVDVFHLNAVDIIGERILTHPSIEEITGYCHDIGLAPTLVVDNSDDLGGAACAEIAAGFAADVECRTAAGDDAPALAMALSRLSAAGIPVRLTIRTEGVAAGETLALARAAARSGAFAVVFCGSGTAPSTATAADVESAIEDLVDAGIEASIRHMPAEALDEGLRPYVRRDEDLPWDRFGWEPAGARWSLSPAQRSAIGVLEPPLDLFEQIGQLRGNLAPSRAESPVQRAINALSVRVRGSSRERPVVWLYGSTQIGLDIITALTTHPWLSKAVTIGGFVSSPGHRAADTIHGHAWRSADELPSLRADFVLVTSESSRLAILEVLAGLGLLDRVIHLFGTASTGHRYERLSDGLGPGDAADLSAEGYASRELVAAAVPHTRFVQNRRG